MKRVLAVSLSSIMIAIGLSAIGDPQVSAGTCHSPVAAYFYYGVPVAPAPNGRVAIPAKANPGQDLCATGAQADLFIAPPGVHFVVGELHVDLGSSPGPLVCMSGLGLDLCEFSRRIASPQPGVVWAQTNVKVLDPTVVSGGFIIDFPGYGSQSYASVT